MPEDRDLGATASMVLAAEVDLKRCQGLPNGIHSLRTNARQVVEDLLVKVGEADDLRRGGEQVDAPPGMRVGVLRFVDDDQRVALGDQPADVLALGQKRLRIAGEEIEGDSPILPEHLLAPGEPRAPVGVLLVPFTRSDGPVFHLLILRQQDS